MVKKTVKKQAKPKLEAITLTIRAREQDEITALNQLKQITGEKTYSGAVFAASRMLPKLREQVVDQTNKIKAASTMLRSQQEILHFMYSAQKQVEEFGKKNFKGEKYPQQEFDFDNDDQDEDDFS